MADTPSTENTIPNQPTPSDTTPGQNSGETVLKHVSFMGANSA